LYIKYLQRADRRFYSVETERAQPVKKVIRKRGLPAGTRKQSDNIADMAGKAKITEYTAKQIHNK
jgi:hypothetical protein